VKLFKKPKSRLGERGRLEQKTRKFYRNGWRLLKSTCVATLTVDQITGD